MGRPYTSSKRAWKYFADGAALYRRFTPNDNKAARKLFEKAIKLDPEFARAYALLAATHRQDFCGRWTRNPQSSKNLAHRRALKAVELARRELEPKPSLPYALEQMGWILLYSGQHQEPIQLAKAALECNPNYADGYALWAHVLIYLDRPEEALRKSQQAIERNPIYPFFYDYHRGHAYYVWGVLTSKHYPKARLHFEKAEKYLREALRKNDNYRPARSYLAAVLSELGRQDEAAEEMNISLQKGEPLVKNLRNLVKNSRSSDRKLAEDHLHALTPYANPAIRERLKKVWLKAARRATEPKRK